MQILAGFSKRYFLSMVVAMTLAAILSIAVTLAEFRSGLHPYLLSKADSVTLSVKRNLEYATEIGIPFHEIRGIETYLEELERTNPEIREISIIDGAGDVLTRGGSGSLATELEDEVGRPTAFLQGILGSLSEVGEVLFGAEEHDLIAEAAIHAGGVSVAKVRTTIDLDYVNSKLSSVFFDTLVLLIAVCLIAVEVMVVFLNSTIAEPLRLVEAAILKRSKGYLGTHEGGARKDQVGLFIGEMNRQNDRLRKLVEGLQGASSAMLEQMRAFAARYSLFSKDEAKKVSVIDARIPLFVFCFAEELQKSFLPLFVAEYYSDTDLLDKDIMMGLPISAFMLVLAVITPFAASLIDRFGNKTLYLAGLVPAIGGYLYCWLAQSATDIVLARSITAVGYGIITISCQSYIAAVASNGNRAQAMATFVGVLMTATMCGTAIGSIFADWLGFKSVFLVSIALSAFAGLLGWKMLRSKLPEEEPKVKGTPAKTSGSLAALLGNKQFVTLLLFCAIPAKVVLTGFLYFFVPIYLASLDASQSEIGRTMMVYSLIIIPISPLASRFSDQLGKNLLTVIFATIVSGIVLLGLYQSSSVAIVLAVVALLGLAHAFLKAPLIVAALEAAEKSPDASRTAALSYLRMFERVGSVAGPLVVAGLLVKLDFGSVAAVLGLTIAVAGVVMMFISRSNQRGEVSHA
ncbi:MFS transporter [Flexibacterium corallicola]|uniref:MFS transporter n=1 Tax=Flexibacterium corallicola TaxID=3037259 RepID=UPI00286F4535|nr:MFS transporter [Pseudovibrio sp. M1P-2-3]